MPAPAARGPSLQRLGGGTGAGFPNTLRFRWTNPESGEAFAERVPFIREVLFGALGLRLEDLICAQRNNALRFFDVTLASEAVYGRVLEQRSVLGGHPLGKLFTVHGLWQSGRRMVTVHVFNPFVSADTVRQFLIQYGEVQPGERMVRDELGVWNGRRQFLIDLREDGNGGFIHPPAYFSLGSNKGYLFYRGQPAFCRGCLKHGHEVSGCRDIACKNCLGKGHLAKDCTNPRRCRGCGGEGHLAHSCPRQVRSYATVLAGAGAGPEETVEGEEVPAPSQHEEPFEAGAPATSSPVEARNPPLDPHPRPRQEAPPVPRPRAEGKAKKRRREQDNKGRDKVKKAGHPEVAPEGASPRTPLSPKIEDLSMLVALCSPPPPTVYGGRVASPNEAVYLVGTESIGGGQSGREIGSLF